MEHELQISTKRAHARGPCGIIYGSTTQRPGDGISTNADVEIPKLSGEPVPEDLGMRLSPAMLPNRRVQEKFVTESCYLLPISEFTRLVHPGIETSIIHIHYQIL